MAILVKERITSSVWEFERPHQNPFGEMNLVMFGFESKPELNKVIKYN